MREKVSVANIGGLMGGVVSPRVGDDLRGCEYVSTLISVVQYMG
jgi:hypothetical protein